ncbi:MAG: hypothetical protein AAGH15_16415 [Myxococcota bacterium]
MVTMMLAVGCDNPSPAGDGGAGDGGLDAALTLPDIPWLEAGTPPVAPPEIPWLEAGVPPIDWPCPTGWREVEEASGLTLCEPYPESGRQACGAGEFHPPGEPACRPIGAPCGDGPFAALGDLDPAIVRYVDAARESGDGTLAAPFPTLAEALDTAPSGATLMLAAGTYEVDRFWPRGVSMRGRCAALTSLVAEAGVTRAAVIDVAAGTEGFALENVRIGPAPIAGVALRGGGPVTLRGVRIAEVTDRGLHLAAGAAAEAEDLAIEDTQTPSGTADPEAQGLGRGLDLSGGSTLRARRVTLDRNRRQAAFAGGAGTTLELEDIAVADTRARESDGFFGVGLFAFEGARLEARRALLVRQRQTGVVARGPSTELDLSDVVIRDTESRAADGRLGSAVLVIGEASLNLRRALLERNRHVGIAVEQGASVLLTDLAVRDTRGDAATGGFGIGINLLLGSAVLERAVVERSRVNGVAVNGESARLDATNLVVRGTEGSQDGDEGFGVAVGGGGRVILRTALVERNRTTGVIASRMGQLEATDVVVRDTRPRVSDGLGGGGVQAQDAVLTVRRVRLERNRQVGAAVIAATGTFVDVEVTDTESEETGLGGAGLVAEENSELVVERGRFAMSRAAGVAIVDSRASLTDVAIEETRPVVCAPECATGVVASLVASGQLAEVAATRFALTGGPDTTCGLLHARGADVRFESGLVDAHAIGVCLQSPDTPLQRLTNDVLYRQRDDGAVVESTTFAEPDLSGVLP